jgi:hypothetical protein
MTSDEIYEKFKQGMTIDGLIDKLLRDTKRDNNSRKKDERISLTAKKARNIVETAIYGG